MQFKEKIYIQVEDNIREGVNVMCNLSQGIKEDGIERGIEQEMVELF